MARRIVRTALKLAVAGTVLFFFVFFVDRNYRMLPGALHDYLPQHQHGTVVTDVRITTCSSLNPFSSCVVDGPRWQRINKDLYLGKSMSHAYVHVQRSQAAELEADDRVVLDVAVGRLDPGKDKGGDGVHARWESRGHGLWLKTTERRHVGDTGALVAMVDVLFGDDAVEARDGWAIRGTALLLDASKTVPAAHVTVRTGEAQTAARPVPRIHDNGKFKVLQLADLHLSTGVGHCRDAVPDSYNGGACEADPRTLDFVARVLDDERPDLVVLSGDQVNGDTAPDTPSALFKIAALLARHRVPYASIFGNHDDEGPAPMARAAQMALLETLPFSLARAGPEAVDGVGNYVVEVLAPGSSSHSALTLYLLDTHAYSPNERKYHGYDWLKPSQIEWFRSTAQGLKRKHGEYSHMHMDAAFIHIPVPEYRNPDLFFKGDWKEAPTAPYFNTGFHDALVEQGIVMVSCGHDHVNEYCALSADAATHRPQLWMCYAGGAGFGGYGGYGDFVRKVRVFDFDMNEGRVTTWKRAEHGDITSRLDEQIIVDGGKPAPPPQE